MHKIAIIGDRDSILGFKALGISVFPVMKKEEALEILPKLVEEKYAAIFITESIAMEIANLIKELEAKIKLTPSIIIIPNNRGSLGLGMKKVRETVIRAIGTDMLAGSKK